MLAYFEIVSDSSTEMTIMNAIHNKLSLSEFLTLSAPSGSMLSRVLVVSMFRDV